MTIYESLEAKNALSYTELSIPLDQQGLVLIDGKVGAGKSSIFDILTHILYGTTAKDGISANGILNRYVTDKSGKPCGLGLRRRGGDVGRSARGVGGSRGGVGLSGAQWLWCVVAQSQEVGALAACGGDG